MSELLEPRERLWREVVGDLGAQVIALLDSDPATLEQLEDGLLPYADQLSRAACLLRHEAERAGASESALTGLPSDEQPKEASEYAKHEIDPSRLYAAPEAAPLIGIKNHRTLYTMGRAGKLKVTRTGPKGGNTRFRGRDLIEHLEGRTT